MIQLMRCAGIAGCLLWAGCGWLGVREPNSAPPAEAQKPPAEAQESSEQAGGAPSDPFTAPSPPSPPATPQTGGASAPLLSSPGYFPQEIRIDDPAGGVSYAGPPAVTWTSPASPSTCPCPECRKINRRWWHWFRPCQDGDCDGAPQVPCEYFVEAHERAIESMPPVGTFLHATMDMQIANGDRADMMLYEYDFEPGSAVLTVRGRREIRKLHQKLTATGNPLLIQETPGHPQLAAARRAAVLADLERIGMPVPPELVLVSEALTRGLDGPDAEIVHERLLQQQSGGAPGAGIPATPSPIIGAPGGP